MKKLIPLIFLLITLAGVRGDPIGNALVPPVLTGTGSPEGAVAGTVGTVYRRTDGGVATTFYVKESGTGNTGWVAYGSPSGTGATSTATYVVQTPDGTLSAEQALNALASGFAFITNGTGVISTFTIQSQESNLEAVMDLQDMQGAVTDAQVPDVLTLTFTGHEATLESLLELQDLQGAVTDAQVPNNITVDLATAASTLATPRTIGGVSFNGSANIVPQTIQILDSTAASTFPLIVESATGSLQPKTDAAFSYDATTGILSANLAFGDSNSNYAATTVADALDELAAVDGSGPNSATAKVDWTQLQNVPADFADGTDDGGGVGGADADAIHDNVAGEIAAITDKATATSSDHLLIEDSAAANAKKDTTVAGLETSLEGVMDLQDMQGAVTDGQVPNALTVDVANSGDSATAFFTAGAIERSRGGTGTDTSAFGASLFGSSAGNATIAVNSMTLLEAAVGAANILVPSEIDTLSELNTIVTDADLVPQSLTLTINGTSGEITSSAGAQDLSAGRIWTLSIPAAFDLGGKTSFEVPNSAAPTVDAFGELAADNDLWGTGHGAPMFFDGTVPTALVNVVASDTPTDGQIPRFNDSTDNITWETFSPTPGGSDTQIQYNDGGVLGGTVGLTYNDGTGILNVTTLAATTLTADSFRILDNVDGSHAVVVEANEDLTSDVTLQLDLNGSSKTVSITANSVMSGTNTGDQTITLTGEATGTGTGSFAVTLADSVAVTNWTLTTPTIAGAITFPDDVLQTFNPGTTNAGLNVGSIAGDPSTPTNGSLWYDSTSNELQARINGATVALSAAGAGGAPSTVDYLVGTADVGVPNAIPVGTSPQGELGGTWAAPTLDDTVTVDAWTLGNSFATTATANDNDTSLATTAYVQTELTAYATDTVSFSNKTLTAPKFADGGFIADSNGNELLIFDLQASAVNELTLNNGATGIYPGLTATGGDTNIGINFQGKGTGSYRFLGTADRAAAIALLEDTTGGTNYIEVVAPATDVASNVTLTLPETTGTLVVSGGSIGAATATTPSTGDDDTSVATTAYVQDEVDGTQTGVHATPATGTQSPTWTGPMHSVWCGATMTVNLPAASGYLGRGILIYNTGAFTITVEPNSSEVIVRNGTAQTGGVNFTLSSGAGNFVALLSDGARWITLGYIGTLAVGS